MGAHREDDGDTLDAVGLDLLEAQRRVRAIVCREGRDGNARLVAIPLAYHSDSRPVDVVDCLGCGLRHAQPAIHHPLPTCIPLYPHTRLGQRHPPDLHRMACTIDTHILDLQALPVDRLKPRDRDRYERAIVSFPGIMERDIWVGVDDEPLRVGGYLALSPDAEVRVGKLTYSLDSAAERLGMTPIELRMEVNRALRRLGFVDPDA